MIKNNEDIKILVIGDLMLDEYIYGISNRKSPEEPSIPVVIPKIKNYAMGGAGNVAKNLKSMGATVSLMGVLGNDTLKDRFIHLAKGIDTSQIIISGKSITTLKQRTFLNKKQIYRIDEEQILSNEFEDQLISNFDAIFKKFDIIILSDYNKGVLNKTILNKFISKGLKNNIPVIIDPKKNDFSFYSNSTIITPNLSEFKKASLIKIKDEETLINSAKQLIIKNNIKYIVITRSGDGILVVGENLTESFSLEEIENPDVTGAGDSVIAALSIIFCKTKDISFSAKIANEVGHLIVQKSGTATITREEINNLIKK